jgi:predicted NBD/HSP70 family sugar kinase
MRYYVVMKRSELIRLAELIYAERETSRADLTLKTRLASGYITSLVRRLQKLKWVIEGARLPSDAGRRKVLLHMNPDLAHVIGIEIGRIHSRIVVTDFLGKVLSFKKLRAEAFRGAECILKRVHLEIDKCLSRDQSIRGIGVAISAMIDHDSGTVLKWSKISGWRDVQLKRVIAEKYRLTTVVEDSARAAAVAERRFGQGIGQDSFVYVQAGLGIGAAIFVDGRLCYGQKGIAGELGHMTINEAGPLCSCGNRGCLEVYASGASIIEKVREALEKGVASSLRELHAHNHRRLSLEEIALAAESHDRLCEIVVSEAGTHLGVALASIVNLLNPARIVLGGTLFRVTKDLLCEPLRRALWSRALPASVSQLEILVSELGEEAAAVGVAILTSKQLLDEFCASIQRDGHLLHDATKVGHTIASK